MVSDSQVRVGRDHCREKLAILECGERLSSDAVTDGIAARDVSSGPVRPGARPFFICETYGRLGLCRVINLFRSGARLAFAL